MSKRQEQELSLKSFTPYDKIKTCRIEREVEDVYNEGIAFYFSGTEIKQDRHRKNTGAGCILPKTVRGCGNGVAECRYGRRY